MLKDTTCPNGDVSKVSVELQRLDYLDNIKWVLSVLVILHHAAAVAGLDAFPLNLPLVIESEHYQYRILSQFQAANQGFFMGLFFFISAYFVVPSYEKKGKWCFLQDKFIRLGIPLLLTVFIIDPVAIYIVDDYSFLRSLQNSFHLYGEMLRSFNMLLGVAWFCWTLIVFNIGYMLYRELSPNNEKILHPLPTILEMVSFAAAMIPLYYSGLLLMNILGKDFLGFHLLQNFPMYIAMYCFGIKAYNNRWLGQITHKSAFIWIIIWIFAMIFRLVSFETIGMSIFLLFHFKIFFNTKNRWTTMMSRSAYAAYIIQVIPLCFVGKLLQPHMSQLPIVNFLVVGIPSVALSFIAGYYLSRLPVLKKIL